MRRSEKAKWRKMPVWRGLGLTNWIRFLSKRPPMDLSSVGSLVSLTMSAGVNSVLGGIESLVWDRAIKRVELHPSPIFVLGHWRTGTTLLHELLGLDSQFAYIDLYQSLFPQHFLLTEKLVVPLTEGLLPKTRPMDNMQFRWSAPQEDEMAMLMMTLTSPYLSVGFPDDRSKYRRFENFLTGLSEDELARWKKSFVYLMQKLAYASGRTRLVMKSPPHTVRIPILRELFPQACYIHLVRNPFEVYASTLRLRRIMAEINGLSNKEPVGLEDEVLDIFMQFYHGYHTHRALLDDSQVYELKYEELVADPLTHVSNIYRHFKIPGFDKVRPKLEERLSGHSEYQTRTTPLPYEEQVRIYEHWAPAFRRYGYPGPQRVETTAQTTE